MIFIKIVYLVFLYLGAIRETPIEMERALLLLNVLKKVVRHLGPVLEGNL